MKKLLWIVVLGLLLSGCEITGINDELRRMDGKPVHSKYYKNSIKNNPGYKYHVLVISPSTGRILGGHSNESYSDAFENTIDNGCPTFGLYDCVPHTRGDTVVYTREDSMIAKARNVCKKIGVTPGTDKFIDCTIKMMSTSSGQQTVIVGQRKRTSIYPLHCRQMGGMSNC